MQIVTVRYKGYPLNLRLNRDSHIPVPTLIKAGSLAKSSSNSAALPQGDNYDSERVNSTSGETPWTVATLETRGLTLIPYRYDLHLNRDYPDAGVVKLAVEIFDSRFKYETCLSLPNERADRVGW